VRVVPSSPLILKHRPLKMIRWNGKRYVPAGVKPLMNRKRGANVPGMPKTKWIASWVGGEEEEIPVPTPSMTPSPTITPTPSITPTPTPSPSPIIGDFIITQDGDVLEAQNGDLIEWFEQTLDPDAAAYLADVVASGGTTNPTIESAVDTLFTSLKSAGLYSKMIGMYPFVGAAAGCHAITKSIYTMTR